jgi:hypothetical protein
MTEKKLFGNLRKLSATRESPGVSGVSGVSLVYRRTRHTRKHQIEGVCETTYVVSLFEMGHFDTSG